VNIYVEEGCYQESSWDIPSEKDGIIKGVDKTLTFVTSGFQNSNYFIDRQSSIKI
jgi:hypothetical protein